MKKNNDNDDLILPFLQNTKEVLNESELLQKIQNKKYLNIKFGCDPTSPDIHFGHLIILDKLKQLQRLGHNIHIIIGDATCLIGDPSGKNKTRPIIEERLAKINSLQLTKQILKILDKNKTIIHYNSKWLNKLNFNQLITLCSKISIAKLMERDDFNKRQHNHQTIKLHELIYPIIQGYDSVMVKSDVEIGGTDQKFNLLMGRLMQRKFCQQEQITISMPILEGLDGKRKMSKTFKNYISIEDTPENMFGKIMSISDNTMWHYYSVFKINKDNLKSNINNMDYKIYLAKIFVKRFYGEVSSNNAYLNFKNIFQNKLLPNNIEILSLELKNNNIYIIDILKHFNFVKSRSEAIRLIKQKGLKVNNFKIEDTFFKVCKNDIITIQIGKKFFKKIKTF